MDTKGNVQHICELFWY